MERCGEGVTGGWAKEMWLTWGVGPGPGVVGAEEDGVEDGVGVSTTHILRSSQCVNSDRWEGKDGSTCGLLLQRALRLCERGLTGGLCGRRGKSLCRQSCRGWKG